MILSCGAIGPVVLPIVARHSTYLIVVEACITIDGLAVELQDQDLVLQSHLYRETREET